MTNPLGREEMEEMWRRRLSFLTTEERALYASFNRNVTRHATLRKALEELSERRWAESTGFFRVAGNRPDRR